MAKRMFAALLGLLSWLAAASSAQGQVKLVEIDGCARLARVIHSEVAAAAMHGPRKSGPWLIDQGQGEISICTHAAKTVSRAFTSAMTNVGLTVSWQRDPLPGPVVLQDYCLNAFLSQCRPQGPAFIDGGTVYVQETWLVVSDAVMREMYNPISSDEVRFRDNDLKLRIGLSLRSVASRSH